MADIITGIAKQNNTYAPGIATYGVKGETGLQGKNGNFIYVSNLLDDTEILDSIKNDKLPSTIVNRNVDSSRTFEEGDIIIALNGMIYQLIKDPSSLTTLKLECIGQIKQNSSDIQTNNNELLLNNKLNINLLNIENSSTAKNYALSIQNQADNDSIKFINLHGVSKTISKDLNIYFNTNELAFFIDSEYPINLKSSKILISDNNSNLTSNNVSGYSSVISNLNSIAKFNLLTSNITYQIINNSSNGVKSIEFYVSDATTLQYLLNEDNDILDTTSAKLYMNNNEVYLYPFRYVNETDQGLIIKTSTDSSTTPPLLLGYIVLEYLTSDSDNTTIDVDNIKYVSLVRNGEFFLNKKS